MQVLKWSPFSDLCEVLPIVPLWVSFPGLRYQLFHSDTLLDIASVFGKSLCVAPATAALGNLSSARVLVEVDISVPHPERVWIGSLESGFFQNVVIEGLPLFCGLCRGEGHVPSACSRPLGELSVAAAPSGCPVPLRSLRNRRFWSRRLVVPPSRGPWLPLWLWWVLLLLFGGCVAPPLSRIQMWSVLRGVCVASLVAWVACLWLGVCWGHPRPRWTRTLILARWWIFPVGLRCPWILLWPLGVCAASPGGIELGLEVGEPVLLELEGSPVPRAGLPLHSGSGCGGLSGEGGDSDCSIESLVMEPCGERWGRELPSDGKGPSSLPLGLPLRGITTRSMAKVCASAAAPSFGSFRGGGSGGKANKKKDKKKRKKQYDNSSAMATAFAALFKPPDFSA